jgi:hypothetical protein
LQHPSLTDDPTMYIHVLQALLAFEGVAVWSDRLDGINDEEYAIPCPRCETENFVAIGGHGYFTTLDSMYMRNTDAHREALQPQRPQELSPLARRLYARALSDGQNDIAAKVTYVFGQARCADCGSGFRVDEAIEALWG